MPTATKFGFFYDLRNPLQWRRPWPDLYAQALEFIGWTESLGFDGAWLNEHHMAEDGYLPSPFVMAAAIAARTKHITIGTSVALAPLYHPVRLAEDCAVIDIISNGRLQVGLGTGYRRSEVAAYGADYALRGQYADELVQIVRRLWRGDSVSFRSSHFHIESARVIPRPVQERLPLFIGGFSRKAVRRAAKYGDGYMGSAECYPAYIEEMSACGKTAEEGRFSSMSRPFFYVSRDPERTLREIAPHILYGFRVTGEWQREGAVDYGTVGFATTADGAPMDLETFIRTQQQLLVLTPEQAISHIRARIAMAPTENFLMAAAPPAGLPFARFAESAELFAKEVLPAFRAS